MEQPGLLMGVHVAPEPEDGDNEDGARADAHQNARHDHPPMPPTA
jgi:hypothetical protein